MKPVERYAAFVTDHSRLVVAALLVATLVVGAGAANVDGGLTIAGFESDSTAAAKYDYVLENFRTAGEDTTAVQVVVRDGDALSRESLLATLRFQQRARDDPDVGPTLAADRPMAGISNLVAVAAMRAERNRGAASGSGQASGGADGPPGSGSGGSHAAAMPPLEDQIRQLESMSAADVEATVERVLDPDSDVAGPVDPYSLLPTDYEPGSTTADARLLVVFQDTSGASSGELPAAVTDAQLALQDVAADTLPGDSFVFAPGIVEAESTQATGESFAIISPVALLLIVGVLSLAYRDAVDVILGLVGVALVLVWMAGFMGWAGIGMTQIIIAVPFLLVGLSIDYALHVVMRYREARQDDPGRSRRAAMRRGLAGVVVAVGAATFTTAVGFLSNAVSPLQSIKDFGVVSAVGICAAFLVFGVLLPALKLQVDGLLARVGRDGDARAFGRGGLAGRVLDVGATVADRGPYVVIALAVVLGAAGGVAATDIDTSVDQTAFLPRDSPDWMDSLPGPFQPGDYHLQEHADYLGTAFGQSRGQSTAEFLVEGDVTDPGTLDRLADARDRLAATESARVLADGSLEVTDPLATIRAVAAANDTVASVVADADTDGDGVPDRNLEAVYDAVFDAAPDRARATIHREDGDYRALRLSVALSGGVDGATVVDEMRGVATAVETDGLTVTATGPTVLQELVQQSLLTTLVEGFLVTFGVIVVFLTLIFWVRYRALSLGAVVMAPVVLAQAWLLGTMHLAGLAFTPETAIIAAIGIGVGVDYAIHVGERYVDEYRGEAVPALHRTLRGTGGALLASAATTAAGFGVLVLALVPSLERFGFVTSVAIAYAFVASVLVLPSVLAVWTRLTGFEGERGEAA